MQTQNFHKSVITMAGFEFNAPPFFFVLLSGEHHCGFDSKRIVGKIFIQTRHNPSTHTRTHAQFFLEIKM